MEIVRKSLAFIDDTDLQVVLQSRLEELERAFSVNANLSTIILSISCIEGIFKHLATILRTLIHASPAYPKDETGKKRKLSELTIEQIYRLLLERDILRRIENFDHIYALFRNYRNFIHPQRQAREGWPVGLGQAQMALGLLNATLDQLSNYIFLGPEILEAISGRPRFDPSRVLHLDLHNTRTHLFVILKRKIDSDLRLKCDVDLGPAALFNFVFNYVDQGNFKMLRLDNREGASSPNALLQSKQKYHWDFVAMADHAQPPRGIFGLEVSIDCHRRRFDFCINGQPYRFIRQNHEEADLFLELEKGLRVGCFNEVGPVKLSNISLQ